MTEVDFLGNRYVLQLFASKQFLLQIQEIMLTLWENLGHFIHFEIVV